MNKTILRYTTSGLILGATLLGVSFGLTSCSETDAPDDGHSVVRAKTPKSKSTFDEYLFEKYTVPYNISFMYEMDDKEVDFSRWLAPARLDISMKMAKVVQHAWIDSYVEVAGVDFMREMAPRIIMLIGSPAYNNDGTMVLGTAEGGLKVTLYNSNWLDEKDPALMNELYFHTMHHEFTHILQQKFTWPQEYNTISQGDYAATSWQDRSYSESAKLGFVSSYAGSQPVEDITEVTSYYLTYTDDEWDELLNEYALIKDEEGNVLSTKGRDKILKKINIMKGYMKDRWNIDMDELRAVVQRRTAEASKIQLIQDNWLPLLETGEATRSGKEFNAVEESPRMKLEMRNKVWQAFKKSNKEFLSKPSPERCVFVTQFAPTLRDEINTESTTIRK